MLAIRPTERFVIGVSEGTELADYERLFERGEHGFEAELVHVDAVLRLYGLEGSELPNKGHVSISSAYFARNELSRRCRDLLRERGTISADDVTVSAMLDKGLDPETERRLRTDFTRRILVTLHDLKKIGQVQQVGRGKGTRWTLPDEAEQPTRLFS